MSGRLLVAAWLLTLGGLAAVVVWLLVPPVGDEPPAVVVAVPARVLPLPPPEVWPPAVQPAAPMPSTPAPVYPPPPEAPVAGDDAADIIPPAPPDAVPPAMEPPASVAHGDVAEPHAAPGTAKDAPPADAPANVPAPPEVAIPEAASPEVALPEATPPEVALPETPATDVAPNGGDRTPDEREPPPPAVTAPAVPTPPDATPAERTPAGPTPAVPTVSAPNEPMPNEPMPNEPMPTEPTPIVEAGGDRPRQAYALPFDAPPDQPRIAVVIGNLGLASAATDAAIRDLPGAVTLSFSPDADGLDDWVSKARSRGHEVLLDLPMEPKGYPRWDPGPMALFTHLDARENLSRLDWIMGRTTGYTGFVNQMGSRFTTVEPSLRPVLIALRDRGLLFVDSRSAADSKAAAIASEIGLPRAVNDRFIDRDPSRDAIFGRLAELEGIARDVGTALGIGYASAATIDVVRAWAPETRRRGFALAPVSAVVDRQPDR